MNIKFKQNEPMKPSSRAIPNSDIQAREINSEMKRPQNRSFNLNDKAARNLANKPYGSISYSDFAGKKYPNTGSRSEWADYSNGGSGGGWSGWTRWYTPSDFGFVNKVVIDMFCECTSGNYDQMGSIVEVANASNLSKSVSREKHWGNGNNWTGSQREVWTLGYNDLLTLGGEGTRLAFRMKMYINRGSTGATNKTTATIKTE
ncbi:MAG: hypothetical protein ACRC92_22705 [Peptostreptococcaceae bacterium]